MANAGGEQLSNTHLTKLQAAIATYKSCLQPTPEDLSEYNLVLNQLDGVVKHTSQLLDDFSVIEQQLQEEIRAEDEDSN